MEVTSSATAINSIYFGLVAIWFGLLKFLFNRLEHNHAQKYEAMGCPSLFLRNNIATNFATLKFLLLREHRQLSDPGLSRFADGILIYFVVLIAAILWLLVSLS